MNLVLLNSLRGVSFLCLFWSSINISFAKTTPSSFISLTATEIAVDREAGVATPFIVTTHTATPALTVATGTGCTTFNQQPSATEICVGESADFSVVVGEDFPDPVTYQWETSTNDIDFISLNDGNVYSNTQTSTLSITGVVDLNGQYYRVVATGADCAGTSESVQLTVNPLPEGSATAQEVCSEESLAVNFQEFITNNVSSSFSWEVTQISGSVTGLAENQTGTGNIDVALQNTGNAVGTVVIEVTPTASNTQCEGEPFSMETKVYPISIPAITGDNKVCAGNSSSYTIDNVGTAYEWSISGGGSIAGSNTGNSVNINWNSNASGNYIVTVEVTLSGNCTNTQTFTANLAPTPQVTTTATDISCFGEEDGTAKVLTNGTAPAATTQIEWSNQATSAEIDGLTAGSYTVNIITDNGCTATSTAMVEEPDALTLQIDKTNITCSDATNGSATANVTGGTVSNDYQYDWSNNSTTAAISNLAPATYTLTVKDDNNCSISESVTITQPDALAVTADITNATCPDTDDGKIIASVTGGTAGYSYQWKDATGATVGQQAQLNAIGGGTYALMITDANNCTLNKAFEVGETDTTKPTFTCEVADAYPLTQNGTVTITAQSIVNNATDNCGVASITFANQQTSRTFNCAQLGSQSITVVVTDTNGNSESCTKTVNIIDNTAPVVSCPNDVLELAINENGTVVINANQLGITATDNCEGTSFTFANQQSSRTFDCADTRLQSLEVTISDVNGNTATCTRTVNIMDNTAPLIECDNGFLQLPLSASTGTAQVSISSLGITATDNCEITSITFADGITERTFGCADAGEIFTLKIIARDAAGNTSSCTRQVIVLDLIAPILQCSAAPILVPLDEQDAVTLNVADLATATDNCSTPTLSFSNGNVSRTLRCDNIDGLTSVEIVATDDFGNQSTCVRQLNIIDRQAPTITCNRNKLYVAALGDSGSRTVRAVDLISGVSDDCAVSSIEFTDGSMSKTFDCNSITRGNRGFHAVTVVVRDNGIEIASCTRLILVLDTSGVCN